MYMLKKIYYFTAFLAAVAFSNLFAVPLIEEMGTLDVTLSNDCFGEGLALSRDDNRSYGVGISTRFETGWQFSIDYYGYTNRDLNNRVEELSVDAGYNWDFVTNAGIFSFSPVVGCRFIGNLGGQDLQNFIHRVFGLKEVNFIYDDEITDQAVSPDLLAGFDLTWQKELITSGELKFIPKAYSAVEYSLPSGLLLDGALAFDLRGGADDIFSLFTGYQFISSDFAGITIDNALLYEKGLYAGFGISVGLLSYETLVFPFNDYANGYISLIFNTAKRNPESRYRKPDFILGYMLDFITFEKQMRMCFPKSISDSFFILPYADFTYGDAVGDFYNPERQIRIMQLSAGAEFSYLPGFFKSPIELFAAAGAGFRLEKYWDLGDYIEYNPGLLIQPEAGIRTLPIAVFPESGLFDENCRYGLSLSYGFQWLPLGNLYVDYQHKVSLGLEIWCDF